jgi:hypothetical protein
MPESLRPQRPLQQIAGCPPATCLHCRHFCGDADSLERQLPGIRTLSSAFGAVRAADGLCALHERYVPGHAHCERFEAMSGAERESR